MHARRRRETENMRVALIWELEESEEDGGKTENRRAGLEGVGCGQQQEEAFAKKNNPSFLASKRVSSLPFRAVGGEPGLFCSRFGGRLFVKMAGEKGRARLLV